ncbi:MerR family transcriptional regulator [Litorimonas sp. RW-G-Af-16]
MTTILTSNLVANDVDNDPVWGIKEFADMFDVTPRTIRFYEDKGLLSPQRVGGVRVFGLRERARFDAIMRGKRLGFSLDDIKAVFDVTSGKITDRAELMRRKKNFEAVSEGLSRRRDDLRRLSADMEQVISIIDDYLSSSPETDDVSILAKRYQAAFDQTLTTNPFEFMSGGQASSANAQTKSNA